MTHVRTASALLLIGLGIALVSSSTYARQDKDKDPVDNKPSGYFAITNMKSEGVPDAKLDDAKAKFTAFAQYNADAISWPKRYAMLQDPTIEVPAPKTLDGILAELEGKILVPTPANKVGADKANYVRELGKALDDALKDVILKNPDRAVKVNAMRMLAVSCKSGAHAHYSTITAFISSPTIKVADVDVPVPAEVRYYALVAAGNLLSAYNLGSYNVIQGGYNDRNHSIADADVVKLLTALEKAVLDPASVVGLAAEDAKLDDNKPVLAFYRRQAIRALGQCRFAAFPPNKPAVYPSIALARVAVSDPALVITQQVRLKSTTDPMKEVVTEVLVSPRADDVAEAVIGLCNMDPPSRAADRTQYGNAMAEVIGTGILSFGGDRSANPPNKVVAWRGYAARLLEAVGRWRARFDPVVTPIALNNPAFDADKPGAFSPTAVPDLVKNVYERAKLAVLDPVAANNRPQVDSLRAFIVQEARKGTEKDATILVFSDPKMTVPRKTV